jgi:hypothetical protein
METLVVLEMVLEMMELECKRGRMLIEVCCMADEEAKLAGIFPVCVLLKYEKFVEVQDNVARMQYCNMRKQRQTIKLLRNQKTCITPAHYHKSSMKSFKIHRSFA